MTSPSNSPELEQHLKFVEHLTDMLQEAERIIAKMLTAMQHERQFPIALKTGRIYQFETWTNGRDTVNDTADYLYLEYSDGPDDGIVGNLWELCEDDPGNTFLHFKGCNGICWNVMSDGRLRTPDKVYYGRFTTDMKEVGR